MTENDGSLHPAARLLTRRAFAALCVLGALLIAVAPTVAQDETATVAKGMVGAKIVEWVKNAGECGFSGAVLAARKGKVVAAVGAGSADLAGTVPNTPATLFEVASVTKQFTATAVLRLVDRRRIKLDDPMAKYLPGIPDDCQSITVRHLLQHTSGIPGAAWQMIQGDKTYDLTLGPITGGKAKSLTFTDVTFRR